MVSKNSNRFGLARLFLWEKALSGNKKKESNNPIDNPLPVAMVALAFQYHFAIFLKYLLLTHSRRTFLKVLYTKYLQMEDVLGTVIRRRFITLCIRIPPAKTLRLDNTGAWAIEVNPSLLCNQISDNVELYIK